MLALHAQDIQCWLCMRRIFNADSAFAGHSMLTLHSQDTHVKSEEQLFETWLLLEYCDKGSLQGWFRIDQHGHVDAQTKPNMKAIR